MADFRRAAVERVAHLAAEHEPAAEAGAAGEIREPVRAGVRPPAPLGQRTRRRVVMEPDRAAGGVGDAISQTDPVQARKMYGFGNLSAPHVQRAADRDADAPGRGRDLADRVDHLRDEQLAVIHGRARAPARDERAVFQPADDGRVRPADVDAGDRGGSVAEELDLAHMARFYV